MKYINFDTTKFNFKKLISDNFDVYDLEYLHKSNEFKYTNLFERKNDQSTHWHKKFYELVRTSEFSNLYYDFIKDIVKPLYSDKIVYQSIPTFRLQFPNNIAVGEYHRDRDYRDGVWANSVKELNYFLPITRAVNTNTIWVESEDGRADYYPMNANYGELVKWDGSNLKHGNKKNLELTTRISMDFRVIDFSNYTPSTKGSINMGSKFEIGGYYSLM
jgi:hypothetical protein